MELKEIIEQEHCSHNASAEQEASRLESSPKAAQPAPGQGADNRCRPPKDSKVGDQSGVPHVAQREARVQKHGCDAVIGLGRNQQQHAGADRPHQQKRHDDFDQFLRSTSCSTIVRGHNLPIGSPVEGVEDLGEKDPIPILGQRCRID